MPQPQPQPGQSPSSPESERTAEAVAASSADSFPSRIARIDEEATLAKVEMKVLEKVDRRFAGGF
eukprot:COSAG06_NODE_790_length_12278_cov_52.245176_5_plen_65_part_00